MLYATTLKGYIAVGAKSNILSRFLNLFLYNKTQVSSKIIHLQIKINTIYIYVLEDIPISLKKLHNISAGILFNKSCILFP